MLRKHTSLEGGYLSVRLRTQPSTLPLCAPANGPDTALRVTSRLHDRNRAVIMKIETGNEALAIDPTWRHVRAPLPHDRLAFERRIAELRNAQGRCGPFQRLDASAVHGWEGEGGLVTKATPP